MITHSFKLIGYIYLLLIPFIGSALAFGIGHVSYKIYLPIWLVNVVLMVLASWQIGLHAVRSKNDEQSKLAVSAFYFIIPWILISMFAGLGPPPDTAAEWVATATEQQVRYFMLVIAGISVTLGFVGLRERLKTNGENLFSTAGATLMLVAAPLFVINMLYWGFYLTELFKIQTANNASTLPDWFQPVRQLFGLVSVIEVALTYLATIAIVLAMKRINWLGKTSTVLYTAFALLAFFIIVFSTFIDSLDVPGFAVSIPASPFLLPYFIGVYLLTLADKLEQ